MIRVLITGASGFIGSFLVENLKGFEIKTLSLRDPNWVNQPLDCDVIIHCAGIAHATTTLSEQTYQQVNCELTKKLYQKASFEHVQQFIFLSTALVFGEGHVGAINLNSPLQPVSAYAKSKLCAEQVIQKASNVKRLILRIPLVLGDSPKGNLKSLAKLARLSPFFIKTNNRRSVLTLEDLSSVVQRSVDDHSEGIIHPKSYDCSTSDLYASFRRRTWLISIPHKFIQLLRAKSKMLAKVLGDFYFSEVG